VDVRTILYTINEQRSVKMITFVLEDPRQPSVGTYPNLSAITVTALHDQTRRTSDRSLPVGNA
jgi:hypothetical protein